MISCSITIRPLIGLHTWLQLLYPLYCNRHNKYISSGGLSVRKVMIFMTYMLRQLCLCCFEWMTDVLLIFLHLIAAFMKYMFFVFKKSCRTWFEAVTLLNKFAIIVINCHSNFVCFGCFPFIVLNIFLFTGIGKD